jgi:hypothetical protein
MVGAQAPAKKVITIISRKYRIRIDARLAPENLHQLNLVRPANATIAPPG